MVPNSVKYEASLKLIHWITKQVCIKTLQSEMNSWYWKTNSDRIRYTQ